MIMIILIIKNKIKILFKKVVAFNSSINKINKFKYKIILINKEYIIIKGILIKLVIILLKVLKNQKKIINFS